MNSMTRSENRFSSKLRLSTINLGVCLLLTIGIVLLAAKVLPFALQAHGFPRGIVLLPTWRDFFPISLVVLGCCFATLLMARWVSSLGTSVKVVCAGVILPSVLLGLVLAALDLFVEYDFSPEVEKFGLIELTNLAFQELRNFCITELVSCALICVGFWLFRRKTNKEIGSAHH